MELLISAIQTRLQSGHNQTCVILTSEGKTPCNCGHKALADALFKFREGKDNTNG
jgi:hypothetical protein